MKRLTAITFEVDLEITDYDSNIPPFSKEEAANFKYTRSTFIPGLSSAENQYKKHQDRFTLEGREARYLYNLIQKRLCPNVKIVHITGNIVEASEGLCFLGGEAIVFKELISFSTSQDFTTPSFYEEIGSGGIALGGESAIEGPSFYEETGLGGITVSGDGIDEIL